MRWGEILGVLLVFWTVIVSRICQSANKVSRLPRTRTFWIGSIARQLDLTVCPESRRTLPPRVRTAPDGFNRNRLLLRKIVVRPELCAGAYNGNQSYKQSFNPSSELTHEKYLIWTAAGLLTLSLLVTLVH